MLYINLQLRVVPDSRAHVSFYLKLWKFEVFSRAVMNFESNLNCKAYAQKACSATE